MKAKLSMAFEDLRGSDGNVTARGSRSGLTLVKKIRPRTSDSQASLDVRANLDAMGAKWRSLGQGAVDAWNAYGDSTRRTNSVNGTTYSSTGYAAFVALNGVLLNTSDTAQPILTPPTSAFVAPGIFLGVSSNATSISVSGSASTPSGVLLEVRVCRLANATNALPKAGYTSVVFFQLISANSNKVVVPLPVGAYALQYRWVSATDGQASRYRSLGKATVGLSAMAVGADAATDEAAMPAAKAARARKAA